jgi:cation:H+ antiporter
LFLTVILLALGFAVLIKGAGWLVDGASALARKYRISDLAIGLTIVAFGTSSPELVVSIVAAATKHQDIVFGNVIGSNNFNLFVILGITGILSPLIVHSSTVWKEIPVSLLAVIALFLMTTSLFSSSNQILTRPEGIILLLMFMLFLYYVYRQLKKDSADNNSERSIFSGKKILILITGGLAALVGGGHLVVNNAVALAEAMGISEKIIGLTIVAAGTSLPELATSLVAALKKNNDIAIGNIIGSNIFNIFLILGITSLVRPVTYSQIFNNELYLLAAGTVLLFAAMFTGKLKKLDRWEAGILLAIFIIYTGFTIANEI